MENLRLFYFCSYPQVRFWSSFKMFRILSFLQYFGSNFRGPHGDQQIYLFSLNDWMLIAFTRLGLIGAFPVWGLSFPERNPVTAFGFVKGPQWWSHLRSHLQWETFTLKGMLLWAANESPPSSSAFFCSYHGMVSGALLHRI